MTEVKECDREMVANAAWGGDGWKSGPSKYAETLCDWVRRGIGVFGARDRHAEQYAQLRERAEKAESQIEAALAAVSKVFNGKDAFVNLAPAVEWLIRHCREMLRGWDSDAKALVAERDKFCREREELRDKLTCELANADIKNHKLLDRITATEKAESQIEAALAATSKVFKARARADKLEHERDKLREELEELRAKSTPSGHLVAWAKDVGSRAVVKHGDANAAHFILSLVPKRKTRLEAAACAIAPMVAQRCSPEDVAMAAFAFAGVDPDEEMPEGGNA